MLLCITPVDDVGMGKFGGALLVFWLPPMDVYFFLVGLVVLFNRGIMPLFCGTTVPVAVVAYLFVELFIELVLLISKTRLFAAVGIDVASPLF